MRRVWVLIGGLAIAVAGSYAATLVATEGEPLLVVPLVGALVGLAIFTRPELGLYLLFVAAILLEQFEISGLSPLTARTNFFQNISGFSERTVALQRLRSRRRHDLGELVDASCCWRQRSGTLRTSRWASRPTILAFAFGAVIGASRGGSWDAIAALAKRGAYLRLPALLPHRQPRSRAQTTRRAAVDLCARGWSEGVSGHRQLRRGADAWSVLARGRHAHEDVIFL